MAEHRKLNLTSRLENWLPLCTALATLILLVILQSAIVPIFVSNNFSLPQLYTAIFGWASVMTGFQFGVYGLILSKTDGFISSLGGTQAMKTFLSYTAKAVRIGFMLTIFGMPLLVANSDMKDISNIAYLVGAAYVSLFVYSFSATARVAYIFSLMVKVPNKVRLPA